MKKALSVIKAAEALVDEWLEIEPKGVPPCYRHASAALELSKRESPIGGTLKFLEAGYAQINEAWLRTKENGYCRPSRENWRWKRHKNLKDANKSPEVLLERGIVKTFGSNWCNQVPVASGLVGPAIDKRAAIDLVRQLDEHHYEFIELKVESNNPLFAAIEILLYGLVFVWSRNNQEHLGYDSEMQPLLSARSVTLAVLAPSGFYERYDLAHLASSLDTNLKTFGAAHDLELGFEFLQFPKSCIDRVGELEASIRPIWSDGVL